MNLTNEPNTTTQRTRRREGEPATDGKIRWAPPGAGSWQADGVHFPQALPYFARETFQRGFMSGFAKSTTRFGLLLSHLEATVVNSFWFHQKIFVSGGEAKTHARIAQGVLAIENKIWRDDLRQWDEVDKPNALARHAELLAIDVPALDDAALAAHLAVVSEHLGDMMALHHRYTVSCLLPIGDLLVHVSDWTGEAPGTIVRMLRGSTPASNGLLASELEALARAINELPDAKALLDGGDPTAVIDALSARADAVGTAARGFFETVRYRAVNYDVGSKLAGEMPAMLVGAVRAAAHKNTAPAAEASADVTAQIRARVPAEHQATFDSLLFEARTMYRLRDERSLYADGFAVGIARRAVLEAGARLVRRGALHDASHAVDLATDELIAVLSNERGPSADVVRARVEWRLTAKVADVPLFLGDEPAPPPDPSKIPEAARRAERAMGAALFGVFVGSDAKSSESCVRGMSVNEGVYDGTARLINDPSEFDRLKPGDVLVTRATAPYFNVVLPLLGAIVTERGGQLCHAAIVAREYGIPGVVGTRDAMQRIPDGARVRVDGTLGEVHVLEG